MFFWSKIPFVRATIFFIIGILLYVNIPSQHLIIGVSLLCSLVYLVFVQRKKSTLLYHNRIIAVVTMLIFAALGYLFALHKTAKYDKSNIIHFSEIEAYQGMISSEPEMVGAYYRCIVSVESVRLDSWVNASGKVQVYFKLLDDDNLTFGDEILIQGSPIWVNEPRNPHEFNYQKFLAYKQINYQHFVYSDNWLFIGHNSDFSFKRYAAQIRNALERHLDQYISNPESVAIIKALVLGTKEDLSKDTKAEFAQAGAMHVLAVSGLHVGIIYVILLLLINQKRLNSRNPLLVAGVVIPVLWTYAFITGLSPSVLRAVTMFSLLSLGEAINRKSSPFNSLAVSAFILLLIDPFLILSVGFQLSYIAVTGILILYPMIESVYKPRYKLLRFLWQLMALSIAAQLVTAPLAAYYFHQFPTYFLLTNLIVIPIATVLVWGGMLIISLGYIPILGSLIGLGLSFFAQLMIRGIEAINLLPFSSLPDLYPDAIETLIIYGIISAIVITVMSRERIAIRAAMILSLAFLIKLIVFQYQAQDRSQIVFYDINNGWVIDFIEDKQYSSLSSDSVPSKTLEYMVNPNRKANKLQQTDNLPIQNIVAGLGTLVVWHGKTILIADKCIKQKEILNSIDFVYYPSGGSYDNCNPNQIHFRKLVMDEILYEAYSMDTDGSFVVNL